MDENPHLRPGGHPRDRPEICVPRTYKSFQRREHVPRWDDALAFYVRHHGTFIEPSMVYDYELLDERGRGLGFIELLMDDVSINPSPEGTVIRFAKRLGA
jgi:hypothetical protein